MEPASVDEPQAADMAFDRAAHLGRRYVRGAGSTLLADVYLTPLPITREAATGRCLIVMADIGDRVTTPRSAGDMQGPATTAADVALGRTPPAIVSVCMHCKNVHDASDPSGVRSRPTSRAVHPRCASATVCAKPVQTGITPTSRSGRRLHRTLAFVGPPVAIDCDLSHALPQPSMHGVRVHARMPEHRHLD